MGTAHAAVMPSISAVCDVDENRARGLAGRFGARVYTSFNELLATESEIDVVVICTPTGYHAEAIIKSLQAGKHVICESPLCLTTAGAWQIMETEKYCNRKVLLTETMRREEGQGDLLDTIENRQEIHIQLRTTRPAGYYGNWRSEDFPGGGALYTEFPAYIRFLQGEFGQVERVEPLDQKGYPFSELFQEIEAGAVLINFESGIQAHFHWRTQEGLQSHYGHGLLINDTYYVVDQIESVPHAHIYQQLEQRLQGSGDGPTETYQAWKTVEAIEKIYKAIRPKQS